MRVAQIFNSNICLDIKMNMPKKHAYMCQILKTRNPALRASQRARLVAMYMAVAIRLSSYVHRVTLEAVSFLPEVVAQI